MRILHGRLINGCPELLKPLARDFLTGTDDAFALSEETKAFVLDWIKSHILTLQDDVEEVAMLRFETIPAATKHPLDDQEYVDELRHERETWRDEIRQEFAEMLEEQISELEATGNCRLYPTLEKEKRVSEEYLAAVSGKRT